MAHFSTEKSDELCAAGLKPKRVSQPRAVPTALPLEETQGMNHSPSVPLDEDASSRVERLDLLTGAMDHRLSIWH